MRMHPLWGAVLVVGAGCRSDVERCHDARVAADRAWHTYVAALRTDLDAARTTVGETTAALTGVEQKLAEDVKHAVDRRHDRFDPAWMRAYDAAIMRACGEDATCAALRDKQAAAKVRMADVEPRIGAAIAAREAIRAAPDDALVAAASVAPDGERPTLTAARAASRALGTECGNAEHPPPRELAPPQ